MAQFGSALDWGSRGRRFKSCQPCLLYTSPAAIQLSRATLRNIKQNLFWALVYNAVCIPVAAGALAFAGVNLNPMIAAAAMSLSSVCVVSNALRLRGWQPRFTAAAPPAARPSTVAAGEESGGKEIEGGAAAPAGKEIVMEKVLHVEGMMCQHCVARVKKALEAVDGVKEAVVDLDAKTAVARLAREVDDATLKAAVEEQDYEVTGVE